MASNQQNVYNDIVLPGKDLPVERLGASRHELGEHNGVNISIEVSDTFVFKRPENMGRVFEGEIGPETGIYVYSRNYNPTVWYYAHQLAAIEGTDRAYCTSSGISAIASVLLHLSQHGGHVVASDALYGGTYSLLKNFLPKKCNITTTFVDITDLGAVKKEIVEKKPSLLYFESISNPTLVVADIPALTKIAHDHKVKVVVDNTFAPLILTPAKFDVDVVVYSLTKYFSGGSDLIAGAICCPESIMKELTDIEEGPLMLLGPVMNPMEAFELSQRLPHMSMRVKAQCDRAMELAKKMKAEFPDLKVIYPGLEDHPQHKLLATLHNEGYGFGAIIAIDVKTGDRANNLLYRLENDHKFGFVAVSLGYYENLMCDSGTSTASDIDPDTRKRLHITDGLIRLSIGYLGTFEQKWGQFEQAYRETFDL